jgi:hypothetical protein
LETVSIEAIAHAAERYHAALDAADNYERRVGHSDLQSVYARMGARADQKDDPKVCRAESPQHAARIVELHDADLGRRRAAGRGVNVTGGMGLQFGDGNSQNNVF